MCVWQSSALAADALVLQAPVALLHVSGAFLYVGQSDNQPNSRLRLHAGEIFFVFAAHCVADWQLLAPYDVTTFYPQ